MPDNVEQAEAAHGGVFAPRGRIKNNTIYGNEANGVAGVYLEPGLPSSTTDNLVFQNNIVWENDDGTADSSPYPANEVSQALIDLDLITYCAVQHNAAPGSGSGNIGPWNSKSPLFIATGLSANFDHDNDAVTPNINNYHEYLHLGNSSDCIDAGQPFVASYAGDSFEDPQNINGSNFIVRDADNQLGYIDVGSVGTDYTAYSLSPPVARQIPKDIGADEYPTNTEGFIYWWYVPGSME